MNQAEEYRREFPPCGYGLLGLCCSDCLLGPCRISPFEKEKAKGLCGADAELLVAWNLLRLTWREGASTLKLLQEAVRQFRERAKKPEVLVEAAAGIEGQRIARKYGLPGKGSRRKLVRFLGEESAKLLDPLPDKSSSLFPFLFSEKVFPALYAKTLPSGSLASQLISLPGPRQKEEDPEEVLRRCLQTSLLILAAEELEQDLSSLLGPSLIQTDEEEQPRIILKGLPDSPVPLLIVLARTPGLFPGVIQERILKGLTETPPGTLVIPIRRMAEIGPIGEVLYKKWALPITDLALVVLVESLSLTDTLGSLALGLSTASHPPLPIQGREKTGRFSSQGLDPVLGKRYLPVESETALSMIFQFLDEKKP